MSRPTLEPIPVRPQNDVYTALLAVALVAVIIGLAMLYVRYSALFPKHALWQ